MTNKTIVPLFLYILLLPSNTAFAQAKLALTLEDIYQHNHYASKGFGPVRWMKDNKGYSSLENSPSGNEIVRYEVSTGVRKVVVSANQLTPEGKVKSLQISDYIWSNDNNKLLVFTNTRKVWRYHTRGDYWVLDMKDGKLTQLGAQIGSPPDQPDEI